MRQENPIPHSCNWNLFCHHNGMSDSLIEPRWCFRICPCLSMLCSDPTRVNKWIKPKKCDITVYNDCWIIELTTWLLLWLVWNGAFSEKIRYLKRDPDRWNSLILLRNREYHVQEKHTLLLSVVDPASLFPSAYTDYFLITIFVTFVLYTQRN